MDHRDTMNTEKTKDSLIERRSLIGEILERTPFPDFLRTTTLQNTCAPRGFWRAGGPRPQRFPVAQAGSLLCRRLATCGRRAVFARSGHFAALPAASRRHSRLPVCATLVGAPALCVHRVSVVFFPVSNGEKHPRVGPSAVLGCYIESTVSSERACQVRHIGDGMGRPVPVPEGRRRRLAGGKSAPADAAPGNRAEWLRAPAGHRRNGLGCWPMAEAPAFPGRHQKLLRCPAGACPVRRGNRGPRPLAQACPRLISCGVPPGPRASRRRKICGGLMFASATAKSALRKSRGAASRSRWRTPSAASVFAKVCAVRTGVSGSLSSVRNGGQGRREEAFRTIGPLAMVKHPSPRPSPRSCLAGRGRRTRFLLRRFLHDLTQRLIHRSHRTRGRTNQST